MGSSHRTTTVVRNGAILVFATLRRKVLVGAVPTLAGAVMLIVLPACAGTTAGAASNATQPAATATATVTAASATPASAYLPQTRDITLLTVPLAVHEQTSMYGYLKRDFATGGVLNGKEAYGFYPSTLTVYAGDTLKITVTNPQDDAHTFTIPDLQANLTLPGQTTKTITVHATKAGIYKFLCEVGDHQPYMWGQLVVLPDSLAQ
jgi:plastocyanin